jgi:hypothetical protein
MRVFLCAFNGFSVAIPMHSVSSLMLYAGGQAQTAGSDQEKQNTYVSLPRLFNALQEEIRHGVILKNPGDEDSDADDDNATGGKIILLTTEVKCETEIPGEEIYPVPKALKYTGFSALFSGIQFGSGGIADNAGLPVLLLNPKTLIQNMQKEQAV